MSGEKQRGVIAIQERPYFCLGYAITAPWPKPLRIAQMIAEAGRHIELVVLKETSYNSALNCCKNIPKPPVLGPAGYFNNFLNLPTPQRTASAAWTIMPWVDMDGIIGYQRALQQRMGISYNKRALLPHVRTSGYALSKAQQKTTFDPVPFFCTALHLYATSYEINYESQWHLPLTPPFVRIFDASCVAFLIRGYSLFELMLHAQLALSFEFPAFIQHVIRYKAFSNLASMTKLLQAKIEQLGPGVVALKKVSFGKDVMAEGGLLTCQFYLHT